MQFAHSLSTTIRSLLWPLLVSSALVLSGIGTWRFFEHRAALVVLFEFPWLLGAGLLGSFTACLLAQARVLARFRRGVAPAWSRCRVAITAPILCYLLFVILVHPFQRLYLDLGLGVIGGVLGLVYLVQSAGARTLSEPGPRKKLVRALDFAAFQICLLFVLLELGLGVAARIWPHPLWVVGRPGVSDLLQSVRLQPGADWLGSECNEGGYHDGPFFEKKTGRPLIVSIADSFGVGIVPHPFHYTTVIEELRGEWDVHSMGVASIGLREYIYLLQQEAGPLRPDAIVVSIFVGNDLSARATLPVLHPELKRVFERDNLRSFVVYSRIRNIVRGLEEGAFETVDADSKGLIGKLAARRQFPWIDDWHLETPHMTRDAFFDCELDRAREVCTPGIVPYAAIFAQLDELVRAAGATPVCFVLIPDEFQIEDPLWESLQDGLNQVSAETDRFLAQRRLMEFFNGRGYDALDLLEPLRAEAVHEDGRRHLYYARDTHFNVAGNRVAGEQLAEFLTRLHPTWPRE